MGAGDAYGESVGALSTIAAVSVGRPTFRLGYAARVGYAAAPVTVLGAGYAAARLKKSWNSIVPWSAIVSTLKELGFWMP